MKKEKIITVEDLKKSLVNTPDDAIVMIGHYCTRCGTRHEWVPVIEINLYKDEVLLYTKDK